MAEIRINADQWNSVSGEEQRRIVDELREVGCLGADDQIIPDPDVQPITADSTMEFSNPEKANKDAANCRAACDGVASVGMRACAAKPFPANLLCMAIVYATKKLCYELCG